MIKNKMSTATNSDPRLRVKYLTTSIYCCIAHISCVVYLLNIKAWLCMGVLVVCKAVDIYNDGTHVIRHITVEFLLQC